MDDINNPENNTVENSSENISQENNMSTNQEDTISSWDDEPENNSTKASTSTTDHLKNIIANDQNQKDLEAVFDVPVKVSAVLGSASMPVHQLLKLGRGAVIELDRRIGEAIDIYVNNLLVARGEVVMVEDRLGITMTEIIKGKN